MNSGLYGIASGELQILPSGNPNGTGALNRERGFYVDTNRSSTGNGANIWRVADRLFVGEAVNATGVGFSGSPSQGSIVPTSAEGANWALRDSQLLCIAETGAIAVTGFSRASDQNTSVSLASIGVAGFVINNDGDSDAWSLYGDVQHEVDVAGIQSYGLELAVKNKTSGNYGITAYNTTQFNTLGILLAGGGDSSYGGAAVSPCSVAIAVSAGPSLGWNTGLVFLNGSLANSPITGYKTAISMAQEHRIHWGVSGSVVDGWTIRSNVSLAASTQHLVANNSGIDFQNAAGTSLFRVNHVSGTIDSNLVAVASAVGSPALAAEGSAADIHVFLNPKGTGSTITDANLIPSSDNTKDLGGNGFRWANLFVAGSALLNEGSSIASGAANTVGRLQVQGTDGNTAAAVITRYSNGATGPSLHLTKSRSATVGTNTVVQIGDTFGTIFFGGADGTGYITGATISAVVDNTPGTNDMPGRLSFATTPDGSTAAAERLRIDTSGLNLITGHVLRVNSVQVVGARDTGWAAMTGTPNENTVYDTATVTLPQLAGRVAALQAALTTHGLIGA